MATSKAQIFNLALTLLGQMPISDPDSETDKRAILLRQTYDMCRQSLLEEHLWNFACKRAVLAPDTDTPDFDYAYQFTLPSDCLRIAKLYNKPSRYKEEGKKILSDENSISLIYIADITDPTYFPAIFSKLLAYELAINSEYGITLQSTMQQSLIVQKTNLLVKAKMVDAQKDGEKKVISSGTLDAANYPYGVID